jgi:hypothetical protein
VPLQQQLLLPLLLLLLMSVGWTAPRWDPRHLLLLLLLLLLTLSGRTFQMRRTYCQLARASCR